MFHIGFGARPGKPAVSPSGKLSKYTAAFINEVESKGHLDLPADVIMWKILDQFACHRTRCTRNFPLTINGREKSTSSSEDWAKIFFKAAGVEPSRPKNKIG